MIWSLLNFTLLNFTLTQFCSCSSFTPARVLPLLNFYSFSLLILPRALPPLPPAPPPGAHPESGPVLPIPPEIRPTLVKYRSVAYILYRAPRLFFERCVFFSGLQITSFQIKSKSLPPEIRPTLVNYRSQMICKVRIFW